MRGLTKPLAALALSGCSLLTDLTELSDVGRDAAADAAIDVADASPVDPDGGCAPLRVVQSTYTSQVAPQTTTMVTTLTSPLTRGNYVVLGLNYEGACGYVSAVTDTAGNGYTRLGQFDTLSAALVLETWGAPDVSSGDGGIDTITATLTSACYLRDIKAVELQGVDNALQAPPTVRAKGTGGSPDASISTSGAAIVFAHTGDENGAVGPGAGWLPIFLDGRQSLAEYEIVAEAGTYPVSFIPGAGEAWAIEAVALRGCR